MILTKNKIIIILSIAVAVLIYFVFNKSEVIKTVTKTHIEYIPETSKVINTSPISIKLLRIKVPVIRDSIIKDTMYLDRNVKKYSYIDSLKNGTIKSSIIADNIYSRSVELETFKEKVTITDTKTIVKSMLFLDVGANRYIDKSLRDLNIGINYTIKDKWRIGIAGGYDFTLKDPFYGIKIGVPLN